MRSIFCSHVPRGVVISSRATGGGPIGAPQPAQKRAPALLTRPQRLQVTPSAIGGGAIVGATCGAMCGGGPATVVAPWGWNCATGTVGATGGGTTRAVGS